MITYKKPYSLEPEVFKEISHYQALLDYINYLHACARRGTDLTEAKSFKQWLDTEI